MWSALFVYYSQLFTVHKFSDRINHGRGNKSTHIHFVLIRINTEDGNVKFMYNEIAERNITMVGTTVQTKKN